MSRPLRAVMIFLALLALVAAQAAWLLGLPDAGWVLGGLSSCLVMVLGLVFRGCGPSFTRAERQRIFGRLGD